MGLRLEFRTVWANEVLWLGVILFLMVFRLGWISGVEWIVIHFGEFEGSSLEFVEYIRRKLFNL